MEKGLELNIYIMPRALPSLTLSSEKGVREKGGKKAKMRCRRNVYE
jgi:hypothetical protein